MEQVCTEQDTAKIQARKTEDCTRRGESETADAKGTSLMEQLLSLVSDTFLQLRRDAVHMPAIILSLLTVY